MKACILRLIAVLAIGLMALNHRATAQNPETISMDVVLQQFTIGGVATLYGQGWLRLSLKPGSTDSYTGTLTDNYSGGKNFPASAQIDATGAGTVTLQTRVGKFTAQFPSPFPNPNLYTEEFPRVPKALPAGTRVYLLGRPHSYSTVSGILSVRLWSGVSLKKKPFIFTDLPITLIRDSVSHLVPKDPETGERSYIIVPGKKGPVIQNIPGPGYFALPAPFPDAGVNFLTLNVKLGGRFLMLSGMPWPDQARYSGAAVSPGKNTAATIGSFHIELSTAAAASITEEQEAKLTE